jgi:glycosyltransferase involved in cell wall biosynthesis
MTVAEGNVAQGAGEPGLVSVVVPTYNRAYIIAQAINSVLAQTYRDIEIIVVDDGSTDATSEVISKFGPKVRFFRQRNAGVSAARNLGLRAARGEFVALLDSDDAWLPWKIEAQVAVLRAFPEVGMVWTDMKAVDPDGREHCPRYLREFYSAYRKVRIEDVCRDVHMLSEVWRSAPKPLAESPIYIGEIFSEMLLGNLVHTSTVLLTRNRLHVTGLFDVGLRLTGEDYDFHLRVTKHGPVALIDEPAIIYRIGAIDQLTHPELAVHIARNNLTTVKLCIEQNAKRIRLPRPVVHDRLAESYAWVGEEELEIGERWNAIRNFGASLIYRPRPRNVLFALLSFLPPSWFHWVRHPKQQLRKVFGKIR